MTFLFLYTIIGKVYEKRIKLDRRSPMLLVTALQADAFPKVELVMTYDKNGTKKKMKSSHT